MNRTGRYLSVSIGLWLGWGILQAQEPSGSSLIAAQRAATSGHAINPSTMAATAEDASILYFATLEGSSRMLLYDTVSTRAVLAEDRGAEGLRFGFIDPTRQPQVTVLDLGADGYFGPPEALSELGLTDALLGAAQGAVCAQPCLDHGNMGACAACTGVVVLLQMRPVTLSPGAPSDQPTPAAAPTPQPTPTAPAPPAPTAVPTMPEEDPVPLEDPSPVGTPEENPEGMPTPFP